jgi:hypothetical protein
MPGHITKLVFLIDSVYVSADGGGEADSVCEDVQQKMGMLWLMLSTLPERAKPKLVFGSIVRENDNDWPFSGEPQQNPICIVMRTWGFLSRGLGPYEFY